MAATTLPIGIHEKLQNYMWIMWVQAEFISSTDVLETEPLGEAMYDFLALTQVEKLMYSHLIPVALKKKLDTARHSRVRDVKTKAYGKQIVTFHFVSIYIMSLTFLSHRPILGNLCIV